MKLGFICLDLPGHLNPMTALARQLKTDHLALLLEEVLTDPTYRGNARKLQKAIIEANGLSVAADVIEESVGAREKIRTAAAYVAEDEHSSKSMRFLKPDCRASNETSSAYYKRVKNIPASNWFTLGSRNCEATARRKVKQL